MFALPPSLRRVGHVSALPDLLLSKEQAVEARLCRDRRAALEVYVDTLRRVIHDDRPLSLDSTASEAVP